MKMAKLVMVLLLELVLGELMEAKQSKGSSDSIFVVGAEIKIEI